jgi:hypothetical protein
VRIGAALDVAHALELLDGLRGRLLAHAREPRELRDPDPFGGDEGEDVRVRRADVAEAGGAERGVHVVGVVLVQEAQQEREQRPLWEVIFHRTRQVPV